MGEVWKMPQAHWAIAVVVVALMFCFTAYVIALLMFSPNSAYAQIASGEIWYYLGQWYSTGGKVMSTILATSSIPTFPTKAQQLVPTLFGFRCV